MGTKFTSNQCWRVLLLNARRGTFLFLYKIIYKPCFMLKIIYNLNVFYLKLPVCILMKKGHKNDTCDYLQS